MENENVNRYLADLEQIQQAEVPEFLFTRIQQKIRNQHHQEFQLRRDWIFKLSFALVLLLNLSFFIVRFKKEKHDTNLAETMNLIPHNNFYHE